MLTRIWNTVLKIKTGKPLKPNIKALLNSVGLFLFYHGAGLGIRS